MRGKQKLNCSIRDNFEMHNIASHQLYLPAMKENVIFVKRSIYIF